MSIETEGIIPLIWFMYLYQQIESIPSNHGNATGTCMGYGNTLPLLILYWKWKKNTGRLTLCKNVKNFAVFLTDT